MKKPSTLLAVRGLNKIYPGGVHALKDVSFEVQKGEFLVIIGLSGSGKSTLLRCLNRMHEPTTGTVQFLGQDVTHIRGKQIRALRCRMAMIFQHFNLIPRHSVLSNVLMGRLGFTPTWKSLFGLFTATDRSEALRYLDLVGIAHKSQIRADQLSGGQQQRVAIARALMQQPELLLADEPVASLDPATCHVVMDYLKKVNEELGITVIANLHFLSLVRQYASRVIALKEGQVVFEGDPKSIDQNWFRQIYGENAKEVHVD